MLLAATSEGVVRIGTEAELVRTGDVRCLAVMAGALYAGTEDGVLRSDDGGRTWHSTGLQGVPVRSLVCDDIAIYAGLRPARVAVSRNGGETWTRLAPFPRLRSWFWFTPAERPFRQAYVLGLAVTNGVVVAGIEFGAVVRSEDGGSTWSGHCHGAFRDCHELVAVGERVYEAGYGGCAVSDDRGGTWRRLRDGLGHRYGSALAVSGSACFLVASRGPASAAFVYRADGYGAWRRVLGPVASLPVLVAGPGDDVHAARRGELWSSADRGETWVRRELPPGRVRALLRV